MAASYALNQPSLSPAKTNHSAVAIAPPTIGNDVLTCHFDLADIVIDSSHDADISSPGIAFQVPPNHSLPPG